MRELRHGVLKPHRMHDRNNRGWLLLGKVLGTMAGDHKCECGAVVPLYRTCAFSSCKFELKYCKACGGDDRMMQEMQAHIKGHKVPNP